MATRERHIKLFAPELVGVSIKQSFVKLNPRLMIKNPVMFTVEIATAVMLAVCIYQGVTNDTTQGTLWYNIVVFFILLVTVLFANFAEALAEARGKAQAESLRKTRQDTPAKKLVDDKVEVVTSSQLHLGDHFGAGEALCLDLGVELAGPQCLNATGSEAAADQGPGKRLRGVQPRRRRDLRADRQRQLLFALTDDGALHALATR